MEGKTTPILIGIGVAILAAVGLVYALKKKCSEGETKTKLCPDGSTITTHRCVNGKLVATGETCPTPPSEPPKAEITSHEWLTVGGQCVARIKVKNIGNTSFTGYIGFSIKPSNYTSYIDAPYRNVGALNPGEEKTFTSNPITIPGDAAPGYVEAWVTIKYNDGTNYVTLGEVTDPNAYYIETPPPPPTDTGYLTVITNPSGASFTAEGPTTFTQYTNFSSKQIPVGNYSYLITKVGYQDITGNFTVSKGQTTTINKTLTQIPVTPRLLITYCSDEDYNAAKLIWDSLYDIWDEVVLIQGATLSDFGDYDIVAIVGGNYAWEGCSQNLYTLMGFAPPTEIKNRCLRYGGYAGAKVYGVAGWLASDTWWLANLFQTLAKQGNLPTATICY